MVAAAVCVAGVALGDIDLHFAWQAWHFATLTVILRGRRGASRHRSSLCVAGVALMALGWLRPVWRRGRHRRLRGGRGTSRHRSSLYVAGVALRNIDRHFAWQAWHLRNWAGSGDARGSPVWRRGRRRCLRGRRGTGRHRPSFCVAGVALCDIDRHFAWHAWHLWHGVTGLGPVWRRGHRRCLRGRRGASRQPLSLLRDRSGT